jgi:hypothetical protein
MTRRNIMATQLDRLKEQLINAEKREKETKLRLEELKKVAREKIKAKQKLERKIKDIENKKARAARTKRLIEIGAYIEHLAGGEFDLEAYKSTTNKEKLIEYFSKWKVQ